MTSRRSRVRALLITLAGLTAIVLLAVGLPRAVELKRAQVLHTTTRSAYDAALPNWNRVQAEDTEVLNAVLGAPHYRSRSVRCVLDSDQAGWMVENYKQVCTLRAVDVYPTKRGYAELSAQLQSAASGTAAGARLAAPNDPVPAHGCGLLRIDRWDASPDVDVTVTRLQAGGFTASDSDDAAFADCVAPPPDWESGTVRFDETFAAADLTPNQSWVAVTHDAEFLRRNLGCRGIVFCSAPVNQPVLP